MVESVDGDEADSSTKFSTVLYYMYRQENRKEENFASQHILCLSFLSCIKDNLDIFYGCVP